MEKDFTVIHNGNPVVLRAKEVHISKWKGRKSSFLPWALMKKFDVLRVHEAQAKELNVDCFWACRLCALDYHVVQNDKVKEGEQVPKRFLQHFETTDHFRDWLELEKQKPAAGGDDGKASSSVSSSTAEEFVKSVLKSGLPATHFTREGPIREMLKRNDVNICSHPTFKKVAVEMAANCMDAICLELMGQFITLTYDTSPALDRRNFLTVNAHFVNEQGVYKRQNLGVVEIDGVATGEEYADLIRDQTKVLNLKILKWGAKDSVASDRKGTVVAGVSDRGPGLFQATAFLTGEQTRGSCTAHAQSLITQASPSASPEMATLNQNCAELAKHIRSDRSVRIDAKEAGVTIPANPSKERWSRTTGLIGYVASNYPKLQRSASLNQEYLEGVDHSWALEADQKLYSVLRESNSFLQNPGPGDAFFLPYHFATLIARLRAPSVLSFLAPVRDLVVARLHRRLFHGLLDGIPVLYKVDEKSDRTRKGNLFENKIVLAMWALTSEYNFQCMESYGLMKADKCALLKTEAEGALFELRCLIRPEDNKPSVAMETGSFVRYVPGVKRGSSFKEQHSAELQEFRSDGRLQQAVREALETLQEKPKSARSLMLSKFVEVSREPGRPKWLLDVVRLVFGFVLTTVECERDFAWLQRMLSEKRLRMSNEMLAAYVLGKLSPEFMTLDKSSLAKTGCKDVMKMMMKNGARKKAKIGTTKAAATAVATAAATLVEVEEVVEVEDNDEEDNEPVGQEELSTTAEGAATEDEGAEANIVLPALDARQNAQAPTVGKRPSEKSAGKPATSASTSRSGRKLKPTPAFAAFFRSKKLTSPVPDEKVVEDLVEFEGIAVEEEDDAPDVDDVCYEPDTDTTDK